ncbi:carbamoyl-phosphate synthase (glutamine-hydrolyzing) large subunit [Pontibacillus sp. HMF3514]|uniref:carbamoyl-phosphate synthase (glutamine-hydrolyzing) large subunit n=1 Tax=Pontibacillus sp. HMF3514 TaxID=2692425 RepID=UPI00131F79F0|nr:carbamoyl-phosphate synthase (glutamine-hydrolyzing) large subunit [Pontibacillus sp. HMF3514]QHE52372.1 carbamoyl-phosphate synthase (glutamine-hydrolyzing) large subunit [Pontibacillus sp. HMF3514]
MPLQKNINKVLVIGSGPIIIGQAAEFDYAGTQACLALKEENIEVVLINNNPATIMTDETMADKVYMEPLTVSSIEQVIKKENPDGIIGTLGGQTGLNLTVQLYENGILDQYGVDVLGTPIQSIQQGEDREKFRKLMLDIEEPIAESKIIHTYEEGYEFVQNIGFPVIIRPAYTLGGSGGGVAVNEEELDSILKNGLHLSPINQVLIEKSIKGWKELEYEVMRDSNDTCLTVCNMENIDPVGVHTGDSMVVAPSQTLTDVQYQKLRTASVKIIRELGIIGGCNIQFAIDPDSDQYCIIEVNPRVSRSSALASKATGYPIASMAAKCSIGFHLDEIPNPITGTTFAAFEPALDYVIVKLPRFPFDKFTEADRELGTQMKATGEVMAIDRTFEGALYKGLRSLELNGISGLYNPSFNNVEESTLHYHLEKATDIRLFAIAELFRRGTEIEQVQKITQMDLWFLEKIRDLVEMETKLSYYTWDQVPDSLIKQVKLFNMSDHRIAQIYEVDEEKVREKIRLLGMKHRYKLVDTCSAEFEAKTPYYYSTKLGEDEVEINQKPKILIVGSGPIRIGQGVEFDYCSVQATFAVKEKGYEAIVINNNPETVSTDYSIADKLYFEPLALEDVLNVVEKEKVDGVLLQFGGQSAINLANGLKDAGVPILGTSTEAIDQLEDRNHFYQLLKQLNIPHIQGETVYNSHELRETAEELGFPILVRPSYVIGGQSMYTFYHSHDLENYMKRQIENSAESWPLLVDRYVPGAECEIDAVCDGKNVYIPGVFEHIEKAGVHSGDSITIFPSVSYPDSIKETIADYTKRICRALNICGLLNIQFVIHEDIVYILEVNPRSSRTVPIVNKVTGLSLIEAAVRVQLGDNLQSQGLKDGLIDQACYYAVKAPVFSTSKLRHVDQVLGPEMKSTGERLGLGEDVEDALDKALFMGEKNPLHYSEQKNVIFVTISEREKAESLEQLIRIKEEGFQIISTPGTAQFLSDHGITVSESVNDIASIKHWMSNGQVAGVLNIPKQGRNKETLGSNIRELAIRYQVPLFTAIDTFEAAMKLSERKSLLSVATLSEYRSLAANSSIQEGVK